MIQVNKPMPKKIKNSNILPASLSQSLKQIKSSTVLPDSLVLWSVKIRPPVLNADSAATVDAVTTNTSQSHTS